MFRRLMFFLIVSLIGGVVYGLATEETGSEEPTRNVLISRADRYAREGTHDWLNGGSKEAENAVQHPDSIYSNFNVSTFNAHPYLVSAGEFRITAYTARYECTGKHPDDPWYGITATLTKATENRTIAADWTVLEPGTRVMIEGLPYIYIVEDRSNAREYGGLIYGNRLDIYFDDYSDAWEWGVRHRKVWIVND